MNENNNRTNEESIDLMRILYRMLKGFKALKIWLLVLLCLCSASYTFLKYRQYTPLYNTTVTFSVIKKADATDYYNVDAAKQMQSTFSQVLQSQLLKTIIVEDLSTNYLPGYYTCAAIEETNLLIVSAFSTDAKASYDMMISLMDNYDQVSNLVMSDVRLNAIQEPRVPEEVTNPFQIEKVILKGVAIGLTLDVILLGIHAFFRKTIIKEEDIYKELNTQCLASIPVITKKKRSSDAKQDLLIDKGQKTSQFNESIRLLRHKVESDARRHQNQVYVLSSTVPNEGKSTVSSNLALTLASKGKNVLLIDADLRKPSLTHLFGEPLTHTLNEILEGTCDFSDAILPVRESLFLLGNNEGIENPTEVLASEGFKNLILKMRQIFDFIIIDTPPSGEMGDASIISKYADASMMVIRQDIVPSRRILEAMEMFVYNSHNLLGCVLNCTDSYQSSSYGYRYESNYKNSY